MMSSQFSYELDERQMRILLQDAELSVDNSLWQKFELQHNHSNKPVQFSQFIPSFNLNISKSVIVPVVFVILIGGLSAMLFSFIDFKKKETAVTEKPLIPNANNYRTNQAKASFPEKTLETNSVVVPKPSVVKATAETKVMDSNPLAGKKTVENSVVVEPKLQSVPQKIENGSPKVSHKNPVKKINQKVKSEALPSIDATTITNLNEGAGEPELDLK